MRYLRDEEYRVAEIVEEVQGDWARTSDFVTMSCQNGVTDKLVAINDECTNEDGVYGGIAAQWVRLAAVALATSEAVTPA